MLFGKLSIILFFVILFLNCCQSSESEEDYDEEDHDEFEDCEYEIDFKTYKKTGKLDLCDELKKPSSKSQIQLQIYVNHTEEKLHLRASSVSSKNVTITKCLITLTIDIVENFKYPISLLTIDNYQLLSLPTIESMLTSLINSDLNTLSKYLKKTLFITKGELKPILHCAGNFYPNQDLKTLNITPPLTKAITCDKEPQQDRFFTLRQITFLNPTDQKTFKLTQIHQDDIKKISRTVWYTCNNPKVCTNGIQKKELLDKTVNYVIKALQKGPTQKKTTSG